MYKVKVQRKCLNTSQIISDIVITVLLVLFFVLCMLAPDVFKFN